MFTPKATRLYGYQYRETGQGPKFAMFHAWLGCRRAIREKRRARGLTPLSFHPLVFKGPMTADQDGSGADRHCFCGELSGQWIEGRDNVETWFEYIETKPELNDIEAAQAARIEFEREQVIEQGGGDWRWETIDTIDLKNASRTIPERRRVYLFSPMMKADLCSTCQHPRTLHEIDRLSYRRCMGKREQVLRLAELRTNDGMDVLRRASEERRMVDCTCRWYTERADPQVTVELTADDEVSTRLSGLSAKIRQRRQEMRTEEVATGRVKRARTDEGEV